MEHCPRCSHELEVGYGFAYGGSGGYVYCPRDGCDYHVKTQDVEADKQGECCLLVDVTKAPAGAEKG